MSQAPQTLTTLTLGTPLSPSAVRVMLLGSGELGKEVLIALQRLGVETIAVDRYENAPGQQVAHHARTITMSDPAQLRALIEAEKPHLVVPEIEAIATPEMQALEAAEDGVLAGDAVIGARGVLIARIGEDEDAGEAVAGGMDGDPRHARGLEDMFEALLAEKDPERVLERLVEVTGQAMQSGAQLGAAIGRISYSKEQEREADYLAALILYRAGVDLDKARGILVTMARASGRKETGMLDTHPAGPERLAAWDKAVAEIRASNGALPKRN